NQLLITIKSDGDTLIVENQVRPYKIKESTEQIGLQNLQQRFTALSKPITYGIVDDKFRVTLPLKLN
ncbi:MAG: histidine kinase, partial [Bacteroidota bacterium]